MLRGVDEHNQLWGGPDDDDNTKNVNWQMAKGTYNTKVYVDSRDVYLLTHKHKVCGLDGKEPFEQELVIHAGVHLQFGVLKVAALNF